MNKFFRLLIAGWGAKKLGGGCLSTIVIFIIIYMLLGQCNQQSKASNKYTPAKAKNTVAMCGSNYK
ncbi:MAG: hypothetical protein EOP47_10665 [Sphingobacteriaceae bacterium]|nr:MAG: hypothetical protein EOP47_10665 [Sphingobacteriaceae bacterium]